MPETEKEVNFRTILLQDGNVEFKFVDGDGKQIFSAICNPEQVSTLATSLLSAVGAAGRLIKGTENSAVLGPVRIDAEIPVTNWLFGETKTQGTKAIVTQIGETKIGFAITEDRMRGLGRTLIQASWKTKSAATLGALLRSLLREFFEDLLWWWRVLIASSVMWTRSRIRSFWQWAKGRSLHIFRTIAIGPNLPVPTYDRVKHCIYCDASVYSTDPAIRKFPFGAEHIIAEGLGGTVELPEASCQKCEDATGRLVEGDVLGRTLKALRVHLKLKKKGSGPAPKTLPLEATIFGETKTVELPIGDYPIVMFMFTFGPPTVALRIGTTI
jgi:hypothetical protein